MYRVFGHIHSLTFINERSTSVCPESCTSQRLFSVTEGDDVHPFTPYSQYQLTCQIPVMLPVPGGVAGRFHPEVSDYFYFTKQ